MAVAPDPVSQLVDALRCGAALSWAMEHASDGDVEAAVRRVWDASINDTAMFQLLCLVWRRRYLPVMELMTNKLYDHDCRSPTSVPCAICAARIRELVPVPPTFAMLQEGLCDPY